MVQYAYLCLKYCDVPLRLFKPSKIALNYLKYFSKFYKVKYNFNLGL